MNENWELSRFDDYRVDVDDHEFDMVELRARQLAHRAHSAPAPGDPRAEWDAQLARHEANGLSRREAIRQTVIDNPTLHKRFLQSYNNRVR